MTDGEGFTGNYVAQGNSRDWPDQLLVHCPTHGYMLGRHLLHIKEGKPLVANLAKPFVIPIIKSSLIHLDRVTKEDIGLP